MAHIVHVATVMETLDQPGLQPATPDVQVTNPRPVVVTGETQSGQQVRSPILKVCLSFIVKCYMLLKSLRHHHLHDYAG